MAQGRRSHVAAGPAGPRGVRRGGQQGRLRGGALGPRPGGDVRERRLAKFRQDVARFRLYRLRFLQVNMRFAGFFKI